MSAYRPSSLLAAAALLLAIPTSLEAQLGVGIWVRNVTRESQAKMTMTVEPCCGNGYRLTYRFPMSEQEMVLMVESPFDGSEAPVLANGKPSGETMAIKRLDAHHSSTVLKMNGEQFGVSNSTLSPDGTTLTVINEFTSTAAGNQLGKVTETWTRQ
jgi:hypothetical protein